MEIEIFQNFSEKYQFSSFLFHLKVFYETAKFDYSLNNKSINFVDKYHTTYNEKLSFSFSYLQKGVAIEIKEHQLCLLYDI